MTNGDKIRARTDEEIARDIVETIDVYSGNPCYNCPLDEKVNKCDGRGNYWHPTTCEKIIFEWLKEEVK